MEEGERRDWGTGRLGDEKRFLEGITVNIEVDVAIFKSL
jgi:hypothetical protein